MPLLIKDDAYRQRVEETARDFTLFRSWFERGIEMVKDGAVVDKVFPMPSSPSESCK